MRVVNGIKVFDGQGNLTQRDYQGDNLAGPDFAPAGRETGTYLVDSDCTGSMVIYLNVFGVPPVPTEGGEIWIKFVISDGGHHIHEVVSENTPPGAAGPFHPTKPAPTTGKSLRTAIIKSFARDRLLDPSDGQRPFVDHTGEGRCLWQPWVPASAGKAIRDKGVEHLADYHWRRPARPLVAARRPPAA